jgi:HlyD family secretion protein
MANAEQSRTSTLILWLASLAVFVAIVFAVRSLTREQIQVRVVGVSYQTLTSTVSTNGKVEPVEDFQAHAPFSGAVKQILVHVGQRVVKGQLLVKMDDADARGRIATAQAALATSRLSVRDLKSGGSVEELHRFQSDISAASLDEKQAAADLAAKRSLMARGAASQAEVAAAQQKLDAASLTLQTAQQRTASRYSKDDLQGAGARLADSQAAVSTAQANLSNIDIRSPLNGTVYNIPVSLYDWVQLGEPILDVADLKRLQVRAYFDEPEIGRLAVGQPVKIVWDAKRDQTWHGHVSLAPTSIFTYGTRNVGVALITIDDPTPDLIPNTNVTVTVTEMQRDHVLSIPREALRTDGTRNFVYRIVDGKLSQITVKVGVVNLTSVEIVNGLAVDDKIVLGPKSSVTELVNGLEVKQVE